MINTILRSLPPDHPWKPHIRFHAQLPSTNTEAKRLAANGAPHGTVIIADSQSAGRGRLGRSFCSPAGVGIYMSVILRPVCRPCELMHLTCAVAVAACDAMESTLSFRPGIKWINDLVWNKRKLGGILTELSIDPKTGLIDYVVVGIGINCNQKPSDFPEEIRCIACSASTVTGTEIDCGALAAALLLQLEKMAQTLADKCGIMERYRQDCITIGQEITVIQGDLHRNAIALSIDDEGALMVDFGDGSPSKVNSGEVSVRGLLGYL